MRAGFVENVLAIVTRTATAPPALSDCRSVVAACGVALKPKPFFASSYGMLLHCRMFQVSRGVALRARRIGIDVLAERAGDDADRAVGHDAAAPQLTRVGIAEDDRALHILASRSPTS